MMGSRGDLRLRRSVLGHAAHREHRLLVHTECNYANERVVGHEGDRAMWMLSFLLRLHGVLSTSSSGPVMTAGESVLIHVSWWGPCTPSRVACSRFNFSGISL